MAERPMIFTTESVRAILAGRKTQTRRLVKFPRCKVRHKPGDILWVKETWKTHDEITADYKADNTNLPNGKPVFTYIGWRSPMFMPRRFSRLSLRVVKSVIQRLHDITEEDAIAEGVKETFYDDGYDSACEVYAETWNKINPSAPFASNPWVEAITFDLYWEEKRHE